MIRRLLVDVTTPLRGWRSVDGRSDGARILPLRPGAGGREGAMSCMVIGAVVAVAALGAVLFFWMMSGRRRSGP